MTHVGDFSRSGSDFLITIYSDISIPIPRNTAIEIKKKIRSGQVPESVQIKDPEENVLCSLYPAGKYPGVPRINLSIEGMEYSINKDAFADVVSENRERAEIKQDTYTPVPALVKGQTTLKGMV